MGTFPGNQAKRSGKRPGPRKASKAGPRKPYAGRVRRAGTSVLDRGERKE